ncbi:MAG: ABC transporter substrate-binding protein [Firmicutes bacterium]|nr:ABC transporter substrate-binding protein [Bacillota bacterium]
MKRILLTFILFLAGCATYEAPQLTYVPPVAPPQPAAASQTEQPTQPAAATPIDYALPDANLTIYFMGASVADDTLIVEAANTRLANLGYNITITPIWGDWGAGQSIQAVLDSGDTNVDIVFTSSWDVIYVTNANRGNFVRLDDPNNNLLDRFGQNVRAAVPQSLWSGFITEGPQGRGIYAVPGYKDYAQLYAWEVNAELLEDLGFNFDDFNWSYDTLFDPMFAAAMEAFQERFGEESFPLLVEPESFMRSVTNSDFDITGLGIFHFGFDPNNPFMPMRPEVRPTIENPDYLQALYQMYNFFNSGFINPQLAAPGEAATVLENTRATGDFLFSNVTYSYGHTQVSSQQRGRDMRYPPMSSPILSTVSVTGSGYAISAFSQQQEQAMRFLNAWYTDSELATILTYGIEGLHFERNADGTITLNQDMRAQFAPWRNGTGNIFILPPLDVEGPGFFERFSAYNQQGVPTALLGFTFDETPVASEIAALRNVMDIYQAELTIGATNPTTRIPEFITVLNANGLQAVQAELDSQMAAFFNQ